MSDGNQELQAAAWFALNQMIELGNILNWPPEIPMEYARAIKQLSKVLEEQPEPEYHGEGVA